MVHHTWQRHTSRSISYSLLHDSSLHTLRQQYLNTSSWLFPAAHSLSQVPKYTPGPAAAARWHAWRPPYPGEGTTPVLGTPAEPPPHPPSFTKSSDSMNDVPLLTRSKGGQNTSAASWGFVYLRFVSSGLGKRGWLQATPVSRNVSREVVCETRYTPLVGVSQHPPLLYFSPCPLSPPPKQRWAHVTCAPAAAPPLANRHQQKKCGVSIPPPATILTTPTTSQYRL